jgi:branched-chain amino acid aminotransferase
MSKQSQCWMNGKLVPKSDAKVSIYDHGFLYGNGLNQVLARIEPKKIS